jgi:Flp pilus assembly protein TadD
MKTTLLIAALLFGLPLPIAALAAGTDSQPAAAPQDPDYDNGKRAIEAKNWKLALEQFGRAASRDPGNADIHNYLGYAHRKSGNLEAAFRSYGEALRLEPGHKGAHEYIGEAYLMANNPAKAEEHLAALDKICFFSCEEYRDLKKEIEEFKRRRAGK